MRASALPDRPVIVTPEHLRSHAVREAIRQRVARQPGLGFAGLLLVAPVALLFAGSTQGGHTGAGVTFANPLATVLGELGAVWLAT